MSFGIARSSGGELAFLVATELSVAQSGSTALSKA